VAYTYLAASSATGALIPPELPLTGVRWGRQLNGSGAITGRLQLPPPVNDDNRRLVEAYKDATDRFRRCIYVLRDGAPMGAYMIHERRYDIVTQSIDIRGYELGSYFDRRLYGFAEPDHLTLMKFGPSVPVQLVRNILAVGAATAILLDLSAVEIPVSGTTVSYEGRLADGKRLAQIIADLAAAEGDLGFDWRVDLAGEGVDFQRRLIMAPHIGQNVGLIAKLTRPDGVGNLVAGGIVEDSRRANFVAALGEGNGDLRATGEAFTNDWLPRVSTSITVNDEADPAVLDSRAASHLRAVRDMAIPTIALRSDQLDAQLGTFAPGDVGIISVEPDSDPWWPDGLWLEQRVISFDVEVPDEGDSEVVAFQFDDPTGDF
jgi:hypothetical protein